MPKEARGHEQEADDRTDRRRWSYRYDTAVQLYQRIWSANVEQARTALDRCVRSAYGVEDWFDDARSFWSRSVDDTTDVLRLLGGLPVQPGTVPVVTLMVEEGSQASGPAFVGLAPGASGLLLIRSVRAVDDAEAAPVVLGPEHFAMTPARLETGGPPVELEIRLVGLNQARKGAEKTPSLKVGDYVGVVEARPDAGQSRIVAVQHVRVIPVRRPRVRMPGG